MFRSSVVASGLALALANGCAVQTGSEWQECTFVPLVDEARDIIPRCARRFADGRLEIEPVALAVLAMRGSDPATVVLAGTLHYVNADGVAVPVLPFDNGADYFVEGLARTVQGGKVGFVDENLSVVIPPTWDFAFPFKDGTAVVCNDCESRRVGDGHGEIVGGRWGVIDVRGKVVVPITYDRETLRSIREE